MDLERDRPVLDDTIWRLYSMTKPITGVALLSLYEQGRFQLTDPIHRFLPEFRDMKVQGAARGRHPPAGRRRAADHRARRHDAHDRHRLRAPWRPARHGQHRPASGDPDADRLDGLGRGRDPRDADAGRWPASRCGSSPGTHWLYSWSTDVCARLVEVISGQAVRRVPADHGLRSARHGRHRLLRAGGRRRPAGRALHPQRRQAARAARRPRDQPAAPAARRCCSAAAGWSARRTTTCASARCCSTAASARACGCWAARRSS